MEIHQDIIHNIMYIKSNPKYVRDLMRNIGFSKGGLYL